MFARRIGSSGTGRTFAGLKEEPDFRGVGRTETGTKVALWQSESAARRPGPDFGGRLLNVYRASGRPS
jgi:hypothetical protein